MDHFLPFYHPNNPNNQNFEKMKKPPGHIIILHRCNIIDNHIMYGSWDTKRDRNTFFVILDYILPFYPPNKSKNQNFEKMKKTPKDIIILHICAINDNHIMYVTWDIKHDRQTFLLFWTIFSPLNPLTTQKIKILKN